MASRSGRADGEERSPRTSLKRGPGPKLRRARCTRDRSSVTLEVELLNTRVASHFSSDREEPTPDTDPKSTPQSGPRSTPRRAHLGAVNKTKSAQDHHFDHGAQ